MSILKFSDVGITAMAGAVPHDVIDNYKYTRYFPADQVKELVDKIGVKERRFADQNTCSSDLCFSAAEKLLNDNHIDRNEIGLLIFVSQTPDYRMPATSIMLQDKLKLQKSCVAFDINLGCSAFCYALSVAYSMMKSNVIQKALILDGETRSKVYSPKDRQSAFLFGDAGIAALIECGSQFGDSFFSLNCDGSKSNLIKIEGGGYRHPSSAETLKEKVVDAYGNIRNDEQAFMRGADVFSFVIKEVPADIRRVMQYSGYDFDDMDYVVFHQANKFINTHIANKMGMDFEKIPWTIGKYGNTSSVSIPLTIISELKEKMQDEKKILMSAFGVGMSWASAIVPFVNCKISDIVEV